MINDQLKWKIVVNGAAVLAAFAVRSIVTESWKAIKHEDPPENPASFDVHWKDAIIWTVATALAAGLARLAAQRGAAAGWKKLTGHTPPL